MPAMSETTIQNLYTYPQLPCQGIAINLKRVNFLDAACITAIQLNGTTMNTILPVVPHSMLTFI